ncbi:MAG: HAD family hydrolase [Myxococcota bacterium]
MLDFYGTLVEEDTEIIRRIAQRIAAASPRAPSPGEVGVLWGRRFSALCAESHGARFETQRALERSSLCEVLARFESPLDPEDLSAELFAYWAAPRPINGAAEFLRGLRVPVCIVSNIDSADFEAAVSSLGWSFDRVVTSECCRAYKPRAELFRAAVEVLGCAPADALHVGDSFDSDVRGAAALGISAAWINPRKKPTPEDPAVRPSYVVTSVSELASALEK